MSVELQASRLLTYYAAKNVDLEAGLGRKFETLKGSPEAPAVRARLNLSRQRCETRYAALIERMNARPAKVIDQCKAYLGLTDDEVQTYFADALREIEAWEKDMGN